MKCLIVLNKNKYFNIVSSNQNPTDHLYYDLHIQHQALSERQIEYLNTEMMSLPIVCWIDLKTTYTEASKYQPPKPLNFLLILSTTKTKKMRKYHGQTFLIFCEIESLLNWYFVCINDTMYEVYNIRYSKFGNYYCRDWFVFGFISVYFSVTS